MKLIIEIPKEEYERLKGYIPFGIGEMLKNGTPFDSVIEDIKTEINSIDSMTFIGNGSGCASEMKAECLKIISKHISGKENNAT